MERKFIDLGLTSGRLWAAENEPGFHQYDEAVKTFGKQLPSVEAWEELFDQCSREWDNNRKGYILTGPNGNTLFLPADGWKCENKDVRGVGRNGNYWSSSPDGGGLALDVYFSIGYVNPQDSDDRLYGFSVRLCKSR